MINYETLLSSYDDKLTLMQWLRKVEAALKNASAVSFNVNKRGDATLTFSVVFEDGSELESEPIILQQGESVTAAHMDAGHLILTLSNGDELDAGNLGAVSGMFINASQHLIVTYQDGTTQDLGAIFTGNVVINGNFEVTGRAKLPIIDGDANGRVTIDADVIINDSDLTLSDGTLSTPVITSASDKIEAQKPVVEVMTGYGFSIDAAALEGCSIEVIYASACKNGNKLTFAVFAKFNKNASSAALLDGFVKFTIPSSIGVRLYNYVVSNLAALKQEYVGFFSGAYNGISNIVITRKYSSTSIGLMLPLAGTQIQENTDYFFRYETTFLLSENLAA